MPYSLVKFIHVVSVILSLTGFFLRGILMMRRSSLPSARWVKVLPHVNDTVLLVAAVSPAAMSGQYPVVVDWVTAKVLRLLDSRDGGVCLDRLGGLEPAAGGISSVAALAEFPASRSGRPAEPAGS
jgi:hypothetical protein